MNKETVIKKNLELMVADPNEEQTGLPLAGSLRYALSQESLGGNAGFHEGNICAVVNFYFEGKTGEIKYFGNFQEASDHLSTELMNLSQGTLRISFGKKLKIISYELDEDYFKDVLEETINAYNSF